MKKRSVGVIRVLTIDDPERVEAHGRLIARHQPALSPFSECLQGYPRGLPTEALLEEAGPQVAEIAARLQSRGAKAVIISCAGDPGLMLARQRVDVPVIGAGSAVCGLALALGRRVGVLALNENIPRAVHVALGENLAGAAWPDGVHDTTDLLEPEGRKAALEAARRLAARGADVIALVCTGFSTIGLAGELRPLLDLPVIDPVEAEALAVAHALTVEAPVHAS